MMNYNLLNSLKVINFKPMKKLTESERELVESAKQVSKLAQAHFSHFPVGAALLSAEGEIFTGCNIESASYGLTICAERCALVKALSEAVYDFQALAVYTESERLTPPCGACRQLLWDYAPNLTIIVTNKMNAFQRWQLIDLLPYPFDKSMLH
jgi:cytidine deaminase